MYIIDSPGFGENAVMDKLLMDYIATNQIFAFIYVIKSDNAGGVQEDRVGKFVTVQNVEVILVYIADIAFNTAIAQLRTSEKKTHS